MQKNDPLHGYLFLIFQGGGQILLLPPLRAPFCKWAPYAAA